VKFPVRTGRELDRRLDALRRDKVADSAQADIKGTIAHV
jgi:hypothetical protein